jgi:protein-L-isoaspartate(D-aspartate) O-methyltransferase
MLDYARARRNMVDSQLRTFDVTDHALLAAVQEVPRELFMPAGRGALAYLDQNVALSPGRQMLQPMVLARLLQAAQIRTSSRVLDVASGLGYTSALLAKLGAEVVALESNEALAGESGQRLASAGVGGRVEIRTGALDEGCPDRAPFDVIVVNGLVEVTPETLFEQLGEGGRLVCLKRNGRAGHAMLFVRGGEGIGSRLLFDAIAPSLDEFREPAAFVF